MTIGDNLSEWCGYKVTDYDSKALVNLQNTAPRFRFDHDSGTSPLANLKELHDVRGKEVESIVLGLPGEYWEENGEDFGGIAEFLIEHRDGFPRLRSIFFGDFYF